MIRMDATKLTAVAVCACGWRSPCKVTRAEAWSSAAAHARAEHGAAAQIARNVKRR